MSEHYSSNMVGEIILAFCNTCGRNSDHQIFRVSVDNPAGKLGPCMEHGPKGPSQKQLRDRERRERESAQRDLF